VRGLRGVVGGVIVGWRGGGVGKSKLEEKQRGVL
jgi:hypothetical protein